MRKKRRKYAGFVRHSITTDLSILNTLYASKPTTVRHIVINEVEVKNWSQRYAVFKKSSQCAACGLQAAFLAIEKTHSTDKFYHFNLFGVVNGKEIIFTKDHIKAKFNNGENELGNYRTMCTICNTKKGCLHEVVLSKFYYWCELVDVIEASSTYIINDSIVNALVGTLLDTSTYKIVYTNNPKFPSLYWEWKNL